jgi:hypothetical protein
MLWDRGGLRGRRRRRQRHLLSDVLLDSLQYRNVLSHLILLVSEPLDAAPHDVEIGRQGFKLLNWIRGSCSHGCW